MDESAENERSLFPSRVGDQLASERARQKLELPEIAARTRIPLRHLEAIETGKHAGLPALPYSAGFVKTYATVLGLDGLALSRAFRDEMGGERRSHFEPEAYEPVDPSRVPSRLLAMIALGVAILLGMGYLLLRFEGDNSELAKLAADTAQDVRPVPPPRAAPPPPAVDTAAPVIPTGPITIAATEDVWMQVSEADRSKTYFIDVLKAGVSFVVPDEAIDPVLRTGRPQSMKVLIGTTELPPIAKPDTVVRAYSLKRDALVAIATAKPEENTLPDAAANGADVPQTASVQPASGTEAAPRPRRLRRPPAGDEVSGSGVDSAEPTGDSSQRPQP